MDVPGYRKTKVQKTTTTTAGGGGGGGGGGDDDSDDDSDDDDDDSGGDVSTVQFSFSTFITTVGYIQRLGF